MITCTEIAPLLDDYIDGSLAAPDHARVAEHLLGCPACQAEAEATRALIARTERLPKSVLPERELWSGIEARLAPDPARRSGGPLRRVRLPAWGLLAAAIGCILFGAALATAWQRRSPPTGFAAEQARYASASAALAERLAREPAALSPDTRAVVERNLAIIDAAIQEAEAALTNDPGNQSLERMLLVRYEQRLALLRHATTGNRMES